MPRTAVDDDLERAVFTRRCTQLSREVLSREVVLDSPREVVNHLSSKALKPHDPGALPGQRSQWRGAPGGEGGANRCDID